MAVKEIILSCIITGFCIVSCTNSNKEKIEAIETKDSLTVSKAAEVKSYIAMFEIPATDISRAIRFYQALLDAKIEKMDVEGMQMGILPYKGQIVKGVIIKAEGYKPSADGVTMYLNAGDNLQVMLDKVEINGGKLIVPKTAHADASGYFAVFLDSEGNKMGLNSPN